MPTDDEILRKIRKLMRLSESPNEHEARHALAKAQALLHEHGLTRAELEAEEEWAQEIVATYRSGFPLELKLAQSVAREFFFVICLRRQTAERKWSLEIFGKPHHVAIARHVITYLQRTFRELWQAYRTEMNLPPRPPARVRNGYLLGVYAGVRQTLDAERQQVPTTQNALITSHEHALHQGLRERLSHELTVNRPRRTSHSVDALHMQQGVRDGRDISLHESIDPAGSSPLPQLPCFDDKPPRAGRGR